MTAGVKGIYDALHRQAAEKVIRVVRQAHNERIKNSNFNAHSVRPELVEG
jgi:hypothetical protein